MRCSSSAIKLEEGAVAQLRDAVRLADESGDVGTSELLSPKMPEEEAQLDWLRVQLGLLDQLGEPIYLSSQVGA